MTLRRLFNLIIALTVTAGLLSIPFAAPSFAKSVQSQSQASVAAEMHAMHGNTHAMHAGTHAMHGDAQAMSSDTLAMSRDTLAMSASIPCCPGEGQANDCASCPLMALCTLSTSIPLPADADALMTREALVEVFSAHDDAWVQGLAGHPPDHPPRSHV